MTRCQDSVFSELAILGVEVGRWDKLGTAGLSGSFNNFQRVVFQFQMFLWIGCNVMSKTNI